MLTEKISAEELSSIISKLVDSHDLKHLKEITENYYPQDLAEALELLDYKYIIISLRTFKANSSSEIFTFLDNQIQEEIINKMSSTQVKELFEEIYTDDIVEILEEMPSNIVKKILRASTPESRELINQILQYNDDTAGSIMNVDYTRIKVDWTVKDALEHVRKNAKDDEKTHSYFVVDNLNNLKGIVDLDKLFFAKDDSLISNIMEQKLVWLYTHNDQEEVIEYFKKYDITVLPILNNQERLTGIITVDDVIDAIEEEVTEDIHKMAGMKPTEDEYFKTSILKMVFSRSSWLLFLMLSATISQIVIYAFLKLFNKDDEQISATVMLLVPLITLLCGTVGHAANQSSTMIARAMVLKEVENKDIGKILLKELSVGILIGAILVAFNFVRMIIIYAIFDGQNFGNTNNWYAIITVSITMYISIVVCKLIGAILPFIAKACKLDPAIGASPLLTTIVDVVAISILFSVAMIFFL